MATTLGSLSIGSTVKIKYDGVFTDFIVIHRGNPSTTYYSGTGLTSGTWLIFKDCPEDSGFGSTGNLAKHIGYGSSSIPGLLNTTVLGKLQYGVQNKIFSLVFTDVAGKGHVFNIDVTEQFIDNPEQIIRIRTEIDIPEPMSSGDGGFVPKVDEWDEINTDIII